ncbi:MAG: redox-sensitive transcriptional activator SoxR [Kofleriaceae bacterium]|nr:MAG: redox-sensitive transcriptional activator SoxR [Kofleriaceae bacterium]
MSFIIPIGEVVRRSGVPASALRFYEQRGLIHSIREGTSQRRYGKVVLRRVAFILFAQKLGLSLDQIGEELAKLPHDRAPSKQDWMKISRTWEAALDARIAELERLKSGLGECIGCGCLSLERCHLVNPADRAGKHGPGARYWLGDRRPTPLRRKAGG